MPRERFNLTQILWDERRALDGDPVPSSIEDGDPQLYIPELDGKNFSEIDERDIEKTYRLLNMDDRWALCLSGGGIRSAAFALGILQSFAGVRVQPKRPPTQAGSKPILLKEFDYLSTVSGGGYIGAWLSAWLYQARKRAGGNGQAGKVLGELNDRLVGSRGEYEPIDNLRRNSHFLAPSFSALSADIWSDIATITRNLLINWALILPVLVLLTLVSRVAFWGFAEASAGVVATTTVSGLLSVAIVALFVSATFAAANRPTRGITNRAQEWFLLADLFPFTLGAALLVLALATAGGRAAIAALGAKFLNVVTTDHRFAYGYEFYVYAAILGLVFYLISWFAALAWRRFPGENAVMMPPRVPPAPAAAGTWCARARLRARLAWSLWWPTLLDITGWLAAGAVFGLLVAVGLRIWHGIFELDVFVGVIAGVPWVLAARVIADVIFVAPTEMIPRSEINLEWQSRAGASAHG